MRIGASQRQRRCNRPDRRLQLAVNCSALQTGLHKMACAVMDFERATHGPRAGAPLEPRSRMLLQNEQGDVLLFSPPIRAMNKGNHSVSQRAEDD